MTSCPLGFALNSSPPASAAPGELDVEDVVVQVGVPLGVDLVGDLQHQRGVKVVIDPQGELRAVYRDVARVVEGAQVEAVQVDAVELGEAVAGGDLEVA